MKKGLLILLLLSLSISSALFANRVSVPVAQTVALNFFKSNAHYNAKDNTPLTAAWTYTRIEENQTIEFYVFDISPAHGFVIVAADDNITPVIGYSTQSNFNAGIEKSGMKDWMEHAGAKIYYAIQQNVQADEKIAGLWSAYSQGIATGGAKSNNVAVAPLLTTTWGQETYYNQYCPYNNTDHQRTLTGCVATAMAQIMKFWNYPAQGSGSYSYMNAPPVYVRNYGNQAANFGATTYNWAAMPASLTQTNSDVATLMYHCGVAAGMDYGDNNEGGSGSYVLQSEVASWRHTAEYAYKTYFAYNEHTLTGVYQSDYSAADWLNLMKTELNAHRPIQYEGQDPSAGGHTWVCDGYDANNMLHMNWGWDGQNDGYFDVSNLTNGRYNFSTSEAALIGIKPAIDAIVTAVATKPVLCKGDSTMIQLQSTDASSTYAWSPNVGLSCANCAATMANPPVTTVYTVVRDSSGIIGTSTVIVTVNEVRMTGAITDVNCFNSNTGAISVSPSGENTNFSFVWSNGQHAASLSSLFSGTYGVTVSDASSCSATGSFFVAQPDELNVSIQATNAGYNKVYGSAVVNVTGGTKDFSYLWNTGENTSSIAGLEAGNYMVTVTDAKGCKQSATAAVTDETTTSVNEVSNQIAFSVYPNPARENVTIQLGQLEKETTVSLKNALGQTILTQNISALQSEIALNTIANGVYFVEVKQAEKTTVKPLVVKK